MLGLLPYMTVLKNKYCQSVIGVILCKCCTVATCGMALALQVLYSVHMWDGSGCGPDLGAQCCGPLACNSTFEAHQGDLQCQPSTLVDITWRTTYTGVHQGDLLSIVQHVT